MSHPLQRLKYLPWLKLFQVAVITGLIAKIVDVGLAIVLFQLATSQVISANAFSIATVSVLSMLLNFAISVGVGVLGIHVMERWFQQIAIDSGVIWALTFCLAIVILIQAQFPLPVIFLRVSYDFMIGMVLGAAVKGRKYWRY